MKCIGLYLAKSIRSFISDKDTGKFKYVFINHIENHELLIPTLL